MELNLAIMAAFVPKDQLPVRAEKFLEPPKREEPPSIEDQQKAYFTEPVEKLVNELDLDGCSDRVLSHLRSQIYQWATAELPGDWVIELRDKPYRCPSLRKKQDEHPYHLFFRLIFRLVLTALEDNRKPCAGELWHFAVSHPELMMEIAKIEPKDKRMRSFTDKSGNTVWARPGQVGGFAMMNNPDQFVMDGFTFVKEELSNVMAGLWSMHKTREFGADLKKCGYEKFGEFTDWYTKLRVKQVDFAKKQKAAEKKRKQKEAAARRDNEYEALFGAEKEKSGRWVHGETMVAPAGGANAHNFVSHWKKWSNSEEQYQNGQWIEYDEQIINELDDHLDHLDSMHSRHIEPSETKASMMRKVIGIKGRQEYEEQMAELNQSASEDLGDMQEGSFEAMESVDAWRLGDSKFDLEEDSHVKHSQGSTHADTNGHSQNNFHSMATDMTAASMPEMASSNNDSRHNQASQRSGASGSWQNTSSGQQHMSSRGSDKPNMSTSIMSRQKYWESVEDAAVSDAIPHAQVVPTMDQIGGGLPTSNNAARAAMPYKSVRSNPDRHAFLTNGVNAATLTREGRQKAIKHNKAGERRAHAAQYQAQKEGYSWAAGQYTTAQSNPATSSFNNNSMFK